MAIAFTTSERARSDQGKARTGKARAWEYVTAEEMQGETPGHRQDTQKREGLWGKPGLSLPVI